MEPVVLQWRDYAACRGVDPDIFFPPRNNTRHVVARAICGQCPVVIECLTWAIDHHPIIGVYGGMGLKERGEMKKLRRGRKLAVLLWSKSLREQYLDSERSFYLEDEAGA